MSSLVILIVSDLFLQVIISTSVSFVITGIMVSVRK